LKVCRYVLALAKKDFQKNLERRLGRGEATGRSRVPSVVCRKYRFIQ
jgi:hypothetical protein